MSGSFDYERVMEHLSCSSDPRQQGIYLGQSVIGDLPIVMPLETFLLHGSNRGSSGSGKTLQVMRMIHQISLLQAPSRVEWLASQGIEPEQFSIVCIDHKGDPALLNHNRICAEIAGMDLGLLDTRDGHQSHLFPYRGQSHHKFMSRLQQGQELGNGLAMLYGQEWSKAYFGTMNLDVLHAVVAARDGKGEPRYRTFREMSRALSDQREFLSLPETNLEVWKEGRHVTSTIKLLGNVHAMNVDPDLKRDRPALFENAIDAMSLFYKKQFVHITVPFSTDPLVGPHISRLFAYCLFNAGRAAEKDRKYRVILFIDEAQHAISRPFIQLFEQARSFGITIVLIHQHRGQLANIGGEDQRLAIDTNTMWSIDKDVGTEEMVEFIQRLSSHGKFARLSWERSPQDVKALDAWDEYTFAKALEQSGKLSFQGYSDALFDRGTIFKLNGRGDVGWVRVRVNRGHNRFVGVVPFFWKYHLTKDQYAKLSKLPPPGPSEKTITVKKEPFDDDPPAPINIDPKSPIVPKPNGGAR